MMGGHRVKLAEPKSQTMMPSVLCCIVNQSSQSTLGNIGMKIQMKGKIKQDYHPKFHLV